MATTSSSSSEGPHLRTIVMPRATPGSQGAVTRSRDLDGIVVNLTMGKAYLVG